MSVAIVDDDDSMRRSITNLLGSFGIPSSTFDSAEALLSSPELSTARCFVVDLRLPGMSGLDLLARLPRHVPAIVITAHGDEMTRRRAMNAGVLAYLPKPFRPDELVAHVRTALAQLRP